LVQRRSACFGNNAKQKKKPPETINNNNEQSDDNEQSNNEQSNNNDLGSVFKDLSLQKVETPNEQHPPPKTMDSSSISTPPHPHPTVASPPLRTPGSLNRPASVVADSLAWNKSLHHQYDQGQGDGTKTKPVIINVNVEFPERNREFDVEWVPNKTHKSYARNGFHIRRQIAIPDCQLWEATIPECQPQWLEEGRGVLDIKGPAREYDCADAARYHEPILSPGCDAVQRAHSATNRDIKSSHDRQSVYYRLFFSVELDNHIFSEDDSTLVAPDYSAMTLLADHPNNLVGKDLHTLVVFWMVGEKHGGRRIENSKPKADISNIFARLKPSGKTTST
jgi:hypothetical protein